MHTHTYIHRQLKRDIDILWHITNAKSRLWLLMFLYFQHSQLYVRRAECFLCVAIRII